MSAEAHPAPGGTGSAVSRKTWTLSLLASEVAVVAFFAAANILNGRNGLPLGGDSYLSYQPWIKEVLAVGPLQFASSHHYVEVLYPILGGFFVHLGATVDQVEIYFPIFLAAVSVAAVAYVARAFDDPIAGVLTVAFSAGWFGIYRMGADFHGQLLAFPFLLLATGLLLRFGKTEHLARDFLVFVALVGSAAFAHVETTALFIAFWVVTLALGVGKVPRGKGMLAMLAAALALAVPLIPAAIAVYPLAFGCGASCRPYPVDPVYWLQVFGPEVVVAVIGLVVAFRMAAVRRGELFIRFVLVWTVLTLAVGAMAYVFPWINLEISDRTLVMLPVPFLAAIGTSWLCSRWGAFSRHQSLLTVLLLVIPFVTMPAVYAYLAPLRFRYYPFLM